MATIKVHLMLFPGFPAAHIELVLECDGALYSMDRWGTPFCSWVQKNNPGGDHEACEGVRWEEDPNISQGKWVHQKLGVPEGQNLHKILAQTYDDIRGWMAATEATTLTFEIEADPNEIIAKWKTYQEKMKDKTSTLDENCAEAMRRFLNQFAGCNIQKMGAISFPWDVYNAAEVQAAMNNKGVEPTHEASEYEKEVFKEITNTEDKVKQKEAFLKHNLLMISGFYDQLSELEEHAEDLEKRGYPDQAGELRTLVGNFKDKADSYRDPYTDRNSDPFRDPDPDENSNPYRGDGSYETFQKSCQSLVSGNAEGTAQIRTHRNVNHILGNILLGVLGLGIFYAIACAINKVVTGKATFFSKTQSMHKAGEVVKSVGKVKDNSLDLSDDPTQDTAGP